MRTTETITITVQHDPEQEDVREAFGLTEEIAKKFRSEWNKLTTENPSMTNSNRLIQLTKVPEFGPYILYFAVYGMHVASRGSMRSPS